MDLANPALLFAALVWGSIGLGCFVYGKRRESWAAMVGGLLLMGATYFLGSAMLMSAVCAGILVAMFFLIRQGH